jgi:hypothetical protein
MELGEKGWSILVLVFSITAAVMTGVIIRANQVLTFSAMTFGLKTTCPSLKVERLSDQGT